MPKRTDASAPLLTEAALLRELEAACLRAERGRCPLSLALFASENAAGEKTLRAAVLTGACACDTPCRTTDGGYALILPGAGTFAARNIAADIVRAGLNSGYACTAGIAGVETGENAHAETLLRNAHEALARSEKGSVVIYREASEALSIRKALVHSHEKRFLFSGGL